MDVPQNLSTHSQRDPNLEAKANPTRFDIHTFAYQV
jgi:hypothetical protein